MSDLGMNLITNDLDIVNGEIYLVTGDDAIAQDLQQSMQLWLGEWFLNTLVGIPFRQDIFVKNPNIDLVQYDLINAATNVAGVAQILDVQFKYVNSSRVFNMSLVAQTSSGQTIKTQVAVTIPVNATIEGTPYP